MHPRARRVDVRKRYSRAELIHASFERQMEHIVPAFEEYDLFVLKNGPEARYKPPPGSVVAANRRIFVVDLEGVLQVCRYGRSSLWTFTVMDVLTRLI
jgi:hypothetical protein